MTPIVSFQVAFVAFATPIVSSAVASVIVAGKLHFMAQNSHQKAANLQQFSCLFCRRGTVMLIRVNLT